jgi:hypothetical protein
LPVINNLEHDFSWKSINWFVLCVINNNV